MPQSPSAKLPKANIKGTQRVSKLTPSQLARKRARDRESQRASKARKKEFIDRLEREVSDLKSYQYRDKIVQDLLRRNEALEEELARLKGYMGIPITGSPYSAPAVHDDNLSSSSGAVYSPEMSPLPSGSYPPNLPDYGQPSYSSISNGYEPRTSSIPTPVLSSVSSPSSSGHGEEYNAVYIPRSVPASMVLSGPKKMKAEFDDVESNDTSIRLSSSIQPLPSTYMPPQQHQQPSQQQYPHQQHPQQQQRTQQWAVCPVYYQGN